MISFGGGESIRDKQPLRNAGRLKNSPVYSYCRSITQVAQAAIWADLLEITRRQSTDERSYLCLNSFENVLKYAQCLFVVLYFTLNEFHQISLSFSYLPAHHDKTMEWSVTKAVKGSIFLQIFSLKYSLNRMLPTHTAKELFMEMQLLFEKKWLLLIGNECRRRVLMVSALNFVSRGLGSRLWSVNVL